MRNPLRRAGRTPKRRLGSTARPIRCRERFATAEWRDPRGMTLHRTQTFASRFIGLTIAAAATAFVALTIEAIRTEAQKPTPVVEVTYGDA